MPNVNIGDIEIPAITDIEPTTEASVDEINVIGLDDPLVVEQNPSLQTLGVSIALLKSLHTGKIDLHDQRNQIKGLVYTPVGAHSFDYLEWKGWLSVSGTDIPREAGDSAIIEGGFEAKYMPQSEYIRSSVPAKSTDSNSYSIDRPITLPIPTESTSQEIFNYKKNNSKDATLDYIITTDDGDIGLYFLSSWYDAQDGTVTGGSVTSELDFTGVQGVTLTSQGDEVQLEEDSTIVSGHYKAVVRLRDNGIADDVTITIEEDTGSGYTVVDSTDYSTGSSSLTTIETDAVGLSNNDNVRITVAKATADSNTIEVDGAYFKYDYRPNLTQEIDPSTDFNVSDTKAPVRVYDDKGSPSTESDWVKVNNIATPFEGDAVVDNGIIRFQFNDGSMYVKESGIWTKVISGGSLDYTVSSYNVKSINSEQVDVLVTCTDSNSNYYRLLVRIERGSTSARVHVVSGTSKTPVEFSLTQNYPYGSEVDKGFDSSLYTGAEPTSGTDVWFAGMGITKGHIGTFGSAEANFIGPYLGVSGVSRLQYDVNDGDTLYWGAIPFADADHLGDSSPPTSSGNVAEYSYTSGTDLPHGTYLIGWKISSDAGENVTITTENSGGDVSIDGNGAGWTTSTTTSPAWYFRYYETDTDGTFLSEVTSGSPSAITVDNVYLIPINVLNGLGVQDNVYNSVVEVDNSVKLIEREDTGYVPGGAGFGGAGEGGAGN